MILTIPELKNRFAASDRPSAKDFADFIDTVVAVAQANIISATISAVNAAIAALPANQQFVMQATPPNAGNAGKAWIQIDPATGAVLRTYSFSTADNNWHSRHPLAPGIIIPVTDVTFDATNIASYDGGGTPGMGAMWSLATDLAGMCLIGSGGTFSIGSTGGEAAHVLTTPELPSHTHPVTISELTSSGTLTQLGMSMANHTNAENVVLTSGATGGGASHNNMQPYKVAYFLRRTTRLDYVLAPGI